MSVMPAAVWYGGSVKVSSGFMNASFGRWCSFPYPVFMPSASLLITVFFDASLPAAGMVRTTAMGSTFALGRFVVKSSHTSSSMQAPFAIAFAESMTDPPPTASTQSTPSFLHRPRPPARARSRGSDARAELHTLDARRVERRADAVDEPASHRALPAEVHKHLLCAALGELVAHLLLDAPAEDELCRGHELEIKHRNNPFPIRTLQKTACDVRRYLSVLELSQ